MAPHNKPTGAMTQDALNCGTFCVVINDLKGREDTFALSLRGDQLLGAVALGPHGTGARTASVSHPRAPT